MNTINICFGHIYIPTQIRLRCSESRDSLWSNSLERSSQHKVDPQSSTNSHANSTRPNKSGAATKDIAKLKIQAPQKINTLIMRCAIHIYGSHMLDYDVCFIII